MAPSDRPERCQTPFGTLDSKRWAHCVTLLERCTFPDVGTPVVCAVSGGPDSMALLALASAAGLDVTAVHVDHGLRPTGKAEARTVAAAADRFGADFRAEVVHLDAGGDVEARARAERHAVVGPDALFGHTADDQAETVLLAMMRGAGIDGLRGMAAERHPILALRRAETHELCERLGIEVVTDPSNTDPRFRRNRVRHELVPLIADIAQRDVAAVIARGANVLADDADLLDALAASIDATDAKAVAAAPVALARRAVRTWLRETNLGHHPMDAAGTERVLAVARGESVAAQITGGIEVRRSGQRLAWSRVDPGARSDSARESDDG